jgi:uncharacterized protein YaeQ
MAQPAILHDFDIALGHVDCGLERRLQVRTARHPSETVDRVWLRVLAYCWQWEERLAFGPGLSDPDAPDLLSTDLTGQTTLWMRVGKADPAKVQRVADQFSGARVAVLFESPLRFEQFAAAVEAQGLARLGRVELAIASPALLAELGRADARRNKLTLTIVEDHLYLELDGRSLDGPLVRRSLP